MLLNIYSTIARKIVGLQVPNEFYSDDHCCTHITNMLALAFIQLLSRILLLLMSAANYCLS